MSKFLNIFGPAAGVTGIGLGLAFALPTMNYRANEADVAATRAAAAEARVEAAEAQMAEAIAEAEAAAELAMIAGEEGGVTMPMADSRVGGFGLGRTALDEEIAAWDIDIRPDGMGLPEGSGDVWTGEEVFIENCAMCHGDFGEAVGRWPVLAGGWDTLDGEDPVKTIGSYWPYLSTVYDYINRAMPFGNAQSLEPDEIYAITAYLLYVNNIVDDDFELSHENFLDVPMPNAEGFFMDDRAETEYTMFTGEPCMSDCKDAVEVTMRAMVLDVTPEDDTAEGAEVVEAAAEETATEEATADEAAEEGAEEVAGVDPALIAEGEAAFRQCASCHQVGENARSAVGPHLNAVLGRPIGSVDGFRYSAVFGEAADAGEVWGEENLRAFLTDPRGAMRGTRMGFAGINDEAELNAIIAYLGSLE